MRYRIDIRKEKQSRDFYWIDLDGYSYLLSKEDLVRVLEEISRLYKEYEKMRENLMRDAAILGAIIIPTTFYGEDPYSEKFYLDLKKIIERYSKNKIKNLFYFESQQYK